MVTPVSRAGYIPGAGIPLQKQLEHANQQSGFTDAVRNDILTENFETLNKNF